MTSPTNHDPENTILDVTPDLALSWLEGNTHNRPVNQAHVNRLAREIKAGRWKLTHQGIAFDTNGILIDGQHRLWAIVEAGVSARLRVFHNEPSENRQVLDTGERRSNLDVLRITGELGELSTRHLATLRSVLAGRTGRVVRMAPQAEADQYRMHREAIEFAVKRLATCIQKGVTGSTTRAVIARAYYSADHAALERFCDVLKSGMASGETDQVVILLRNFLILTCETGKGDSARRLRYAKTEWALSAFLQGKVSQRLCSATDELFPLPDEAPSDSAAA